MLRCCHKTPDKAEVRDEPAVEEPHGGSGATILPPYPSLILVILEPVRSSRETRSQNPREQRAPFPLGQDFSQRHLMDMIYSMQVRTRFVYTMESHIYEWLMQEIGV